MATTTRLAAALVALAAWAGLTAQFLASFEQLGSAAETVWIMLRYFTVITNLLVAILFTAIASGQTRFAHPALVAGAALAIVLVGVVYWTLLRGLVELSGGAALADFLLHTVTPILVPMYWLALVRKGELSFLHPLLVATYPLAYFAYALMRGAMDGRYPYPFLDVGKLGWGSVALTGAGIVLCFLVAGFALVWMDDRLGRRSTANSN